MKQYLQGTRKGFLLALIIVVAFILFMSTIIWSYHVGSEMGMSSIFAPLMRYHTVFMISMGAFGVAVGASVFYLMSEKVEKTQSTAKGSSEVLLRFLTQEEQAVVMHLVKHEGSRLQSQLSRELNLTRLKIHRILARLEDKGVVQIEDYGKTNTVRLQQDIYESLQS